MAKRRGKSDLRAELGTRVAGLVGILIFFTAFNWFKDTDATTQLGLSAGVAVLAAFITLFLIMVLFRRKPHIETTFNFEETSTPKQKAATEFEYEVAGLIHKLTGKRTEVVGGSGDGGIDIKVYDEQGRMVGIVQCKNLAAHKTVYPAHIRDLNTVRHFHHVNIAYLVSTGRFTEDSQKLAKQLGIRLIDGQALQRLRQQAIHGKSAAGFTGK